VFAWAEDSIAERLRVVAFDGLMRDPGAVVARLTDWLDAR